MENKSSYLFLIGTLLYSLYSCTKTEYIEIERIVKETIEIEKENPPSSNEIFKLENQSVLIATNGWKGICHGETQYIAIGNEGYFMSSSDGKTWNKPKPIHQGNKIDWKNIEYSNGIFVISGENQTGHYISFTKDGTVWAEPVMDSGNGRIIAKFKCAGSKIQMCKNSGFFHPVKSV